MTSKTGKHPQAFFWRELFEKRPDLAPPGYEETVIKMGYRDAPEDPPDDCEIEF